MVSIITHLNYFEESTLFDITTEIPGRLAVQSKHDVSDYIHALYSNGFDFFKVITQKNTLLGCKQFRMGTNRWLSSSEPRKRAQGSAYKLAWVSKCRT